MRVPNTTHDHANVHTAGGATATRMSCRHESVYPIHNVDPPLHEGSCKLEKDGKLLTL